MIIDTSAMVAILYSEPLLFKGNDFTGMDIRSATWHATLAWRGMAVC